MNNHFRREVFAQNLKRAREKADLTKKALSEESGVSIVSLVDYESGSKSPNLKSVCAIANALNVSIDWLCGFQYTEDGPTGSGPNYITGRFLFSTIKLLDNSFTKEFFESLDLNLIKNTPIYNFITKYIEMKESFRQEAYNSEYYKYATSMLVGKYKKYDVNELFIVCSEDSVSSENDSDSVL